jgi:hypothetical protein
LGQKVEEAEMRSKELMREGVARNLSREERKMLAIVRQIEAMEHKEKAVKAVPETVSEAVSEAGDAGRASACCRSSMKAVKAVSEAVTEAVTEACAWPTQLEGRVGHGNQRLGEKRRVREACDTGRGEAARQQQQGRCGGGAGAGGEALKINPAKFPHNRKDKARKVPEDKGGLKIKCVECPETRIRNCKQYGGSSVCEHNRRRRRCKQCDGSGICEHNRERSGCKQCGGSMICEHNRERRRCKQCGGSSI